MTEAGGRHICIYTRLLCFRIFASSTLVQFEWLKEKLASVAWILAGPEIFKTQSTIFRKSNRLLPYRYTFLLHPRRMKLRSIKLVQSFIELYLQHTYSQITYFKLLSFTIIPKSSSIIQCQVKSLKSKHCNRQSAKQRTEGGTWIRQCIWSCKCYHRTAFCLCSGHRVLGDEVSSDQYVSSSEGKNNESWNRS